MCGIFGLVKNEKSNISDSDTLVINKLLSFHKLEVVKLQELLLILEINRYI